MADVHPNALAGRPGRHDLWLNNNNPWIADIGSVDQTIDAAADIEFILGGAPATTRRIRVALIAPGKSFLTASTVVQPKKNWTAASEKVTSSCTVARAAVAPNQLPGKRLPLSGFRLVNL